MPCLKLVGKARGWALGIGRCGAWRGGAFRLGDSQPMAAGEGGAGSAALGWGALGCRLPTRGQRRPALALGLRAAAGRRGRSCRRAGGKAGPCPGRPPRLSPSPLGQAPSPGPRSPAGPGPLPSALPGASPRRGRCRRLPSCGRRRSFRTHPPRRDTLRGLRPLHPLLRPAVVAPRVARPSAPSPREL